nr:hypothetical protein [Tanacetum cinerariifolium]
GLAGHFGRDKTLALLCEQFYWPKMEHDVNKLLERCRTYHIVKTHSSNAEIVKLHGFPKTLTFDRDFKVTEVVNRSLRNLLKILIKDNTKQWDLILPQVEFSYNRSLNHTSSKSPFEIVYGRNLITPLDLVPVLEVGWFSDEGADQCEQIKELHQLV